MVYAIYTPSNDASTAPSLQYSYLGPLSPDDAVDMTVQLQESICVLHAFDSEADFDAFMDDQDQMFYHWRAMDEVYDMMPDYEPEHDFDDLDDLPF